MNFKIFYGAKLKLTESDRDMFSRGNYVCRKLLQNHKGMPVAVSQNKDKDFPVWRVDYGFSTIVFLTFEEAMDFCHGRFYQLNGEAV